MNQETSANQRTYISKIHRRYQRPDSLPPTSSRISNHPKKTTTEGPLTGPPKLLQGVRES